jgi:hypothetical protein
MLVLWSFIVCAVWFGESLWRGGAVKVSKERSRGEGVRLEPSPDAVLSQDQAVELKKYLVKDGGVMPAFLQEGLLRKLVKRVDEMEEKVNWLDGEAVQLLVDIRATLKDHEDFIRKLRDMAVQGKKDTIQ